MSEVGRLGGQEVDLVLLGAGGHARVLLDVVALRWPDWRVAILSRDGGDSRTAVGQVVFRGVDDDLPRLAAGSPGAHFTVAAGSVQVGSLRRSLFALGLQCGLRGAMIVHPAAVIAGEAVLGDGTQVLALAVVNPGARIGRNVIINTGAIIEHDCAVADHVHLSPGAVLCGGAVVEEGAHVGAGAVVRQGVRIGKMAQVGAGAVVVRDVEPSEVVVGVPARAMPSSSRGQR